MGKYHYTSCKLIILISDNVQKSTAAACKFLPTRYIYLCNDISNNGRYSYNFFFVLSEVI